MSLLGTVKKLLARPTPPPDVELGRNDHCWCGSGKKYKHCHLASDERRRSAARAAARPSSAGGMF